MESIKFIDLLRFSDDDFKKLKLVFNSNWNYTPSGRPDYVREIPFVINIIARMIAPIIRTALMTISRRIAQRAISVITRIHVFL